MKNNIKNLWKQMLTETRKTVIESILNDPEFEVTDPIYVKQTWIWGERTPEKYQPRVVEIFQNAIKIQIKNTQAVVSESNQKI